jgi:DNA-binding CsgD family transcriptional regulator
VYSAYVADKRAAKFMSTSTHAHYAMALIGNGESEMAMALAMRGVDEAHSLLDVEAARANGAAALFGYAVAGDYEPIENLLGTLLAAGELPPFPAGARQSLLGTAAVIAIRRGSVALGERYIRELDSAPTVDGILPGQSDAWARAQVLAFNGQAEAAASRLWDAGEDLWVRGGRVSALLAQLSASEIAPTAARLATVEQRLRDVPSPLLDAQYQFVAALDAGDSVALGRSAVALLATGQPGRAVSALRRVAALAKEEDDPQATESAEAEIAKILDALPRRDLDAARFAAVSISLTERELEVARFVAEGLANPEIASRLVLSVRTVESHMHRIMRKLDLPNRQALKAYVESNMLR